MILKINHEATGFGKTHPGVYDDPAGDHPVDLTRCQVACCYMERAGENNLQQVVGTAVINKCAGRMGSISGSKAFQDVYMDPEVILV